MTKVKQTDLIVFAKGGKVVSFPTDTVPALAVIPEKSAEIFRLKQRPKNKPLILMGASAESLWQYVSGSQQEWSIWNNIAKKYWPGALTLVLPASNLVPKAINPNDPTSIGLRVPACPIALEILNQTGALATTSANRSGEDPLQTMSEIEAVFPNVYCLDYKEEYKNSTIPSTVVKWTPKGWDILRQGAIKKL